MNEKRNCLNIVSGQRRGRNSERIKHNQRLLPAAMTAQCWDWQSNYDSSLKLNAFFGFFGGWLMWVKLEKQFQCVGICLSRLSIHPCYHHTGSGSSLLLLLLLIQLPELLFSKAFCWLSSASQAQHPNLNHLSFSSFSSLWCYSTPASLFFFRTSATAAADDTTSALACLENSCLLFSPSTSKALFIWSFFAPLPFILCSSVHCVLWASENVLCLISFTFHKLKAEQPNGHRRRMWYKGLRCFRWQKETFWPLSH